MFCAEPSDLPGWRAPTAARYDRTMRLTILILMGLTLTAAAEEPQVVLEFRPLPFIARAESLEEARGLDAETFDLGYCALLVSRLAHPDLDLDRWLGELDKLAQSALKRVAGKPRVTARMAIDAISDELKARRISCPARGLGSVDPRNAYLDKTLAAGKGDCVALTVLYLAIAERMSLPGMHLVELPDHVFVRHERGDARFNVEATSGGKAVSDARYRKDFPYAREAVGYYQVSRSPRWAVAYLLVEHGLLRWQADDVPAASEAFREALAWAPEHLYARYNQAGVQLRMGNYEAARDSYRAYLERRPEHALGWFGLARATLRLKDHGAAEAALAKGRNLDPKNPEIRQMDAELALARGDVQAARKAIGHRIDTLEGRFLLARIHIKAGKRTEAKAVLRKLVKQYPKIDAPARLLANLLVLEKSRKQAIKVLEGLVEQRPELAPVRAQLGILCRTIGEHAKAATHLAEAVRLDPSKPEWSVGHVSSLIELGKDKDAGAAARAASDRHPEHKQLAKMAGEIAKDLLDDHANGRKYLLRYKQLGGTDESVLRYLEAGE